jgi:hypothetical protein
LAVPLRTIRNRNGSVDRVEPAQRAVRHRATHGGRSSKHTSGCQGLYASAYSSSTSCTLDKLGTYGRDTALLLLPGLDVVFLSVARTVSYETGSSTTANSTSLSAKSCNAQVSRPTGA